MFNNQNKSLFYQKNKPQMVSEPPEKTSPFRWVGRILWKTTRRICMFLGVMVFISIITSSVFVVLFQTQTVPSLLPDEMVLYYRLDGGIKDSRVKPSLKDPFPTREVTMPQLVRVLNAAEEDDRVKGLILSLHAQPMGVAQIQEFRQAIKDFKKAGKFAYIIAPDYGAGGGIGQYYFASVFDRIWMHPVGVVSMSGISMETPYVKNVLDKLGITPQFFQRKEFKSAFESFTSDRMSDANREAMQAIVDELGSQITEGIAQGRGFEDSDVKGFMADVLIPAQESLDKKLVDELGYGDDLLAYIYKTHALDDVEIIDFPKYAGHVISKKRGVEDVAYVRIAGTLRLSPNTRGNNYNDQDLLTSGSDIAAAIQAAARDPYIRAIVLRVDSPGGTPAASEVIRHAVVKAQAEGKIVYISMANVAASGGYWLSADADKIFALPATLTGSIGVVGGKITVQELAKKLDVRFETVEYGENAGFWSMVQPFNKAQAKRFNIMLDATYERFITLVAEGRGMSIEEAEKHAKGRVWTGRQARDLNLIDGLGGLGITLDELALELGYEDQADLTLVQFPRPKRNYEEILEFLEEQAVFMGAIGQFQPLLESLSTSLHLKTLAKDSMNGGLVYSDIDGI